MSSTILLFAEVLALFLLVNIAPAFTQVENAFIQKNHTFDNDEAGLINPAGLAFVPEHNVFVALEKPADGQTRLVLISPFSQPLAESVVTAEFTDPANFTYDGRTQQLIYFDTSTSTLWQMPLTGPQFTATWQRLHVAAAPAQLQNTQGLTVDAASGTFYFLDSASQQITQVTLDDAQRAAGQDTVAIRSLQTISVAETAVSDAQNLTFNPQNNHLYFLSPSQQQIFEITTSGQLVTTYDYGPFNVNQPQSLVVAPSRDLTDAAGTVSLYMVTAAEATGLNGRVIEFTLTSINRVAGVPTDVAVLVQRTRTSQFSPPSPDPSGIAYINHRKSLLLSDSEVNEMPNYFEDANVFETNLGGDLLNTFTTFPKFSDEPTGIAYNPANRHLFFSDDTGIKSIYELDPGPDKQYGTADDIITTFSTEDFGAMDPEGVAFDTVRGHLFVVEGANKEVYDIDPGPNGKFDGVAPGGDDIVTHFDTAHLGLDDPEGIEYDRATRHLYVLASGGDVMGELDINGTLLRYVDLSAINMIKPAGLAYAPASGNPNLKHMYMVDRGIDNDDNPNENDGRLFEISIEGDQPPDVNAGVDQLINVPQKATLQGTAFDDGLPNPPGDLTTTWSKVSGPGSVTFANASKLTTQATFGKPGTYVLRLTADDGALTASDTVIIKQYYNVFLPFKR